MCRTLEIIHIQLKKGTKNKKILTQEKKSNKTQNILLQKWGLMIQCFQYAHILYVVYVELLGKWFYRMTFELKMHFSKPVYQTLKKHKEEDWPWQSETVTFIEYCHQVWIKSAQKCFKKSRQNQNVKCEKCKISWFNPTTSFSHVLIILWESEKFSLTCQNFSLSEEIF